MSTESDRVPVSTRGRERGGSSYLGDSTVCPGRVVVTSLVDLRSNFRLRVGENPGCDPRLSLIRHKSSSGSIMEILILREGRNRSRKLSQVCLGRGKEVLSSVLPKKKSILR